MSTYTATAITTTKNLTTKLMCSTNNNNSNSRIGNTTAVLCNNSTQSPSKLNCDRNCVSESESDDSFIVFQDISPCKSTPIRDTYNFRRRSREISECSSDDFIVFENGSRDTSFCYETTTDDDDAEDEADAVQLPNIKLSKGKRVKFNLRPIVHEIRAWKFAYAQARKGHWHQIGWDRERFKRRVNDLSEILSPVLAADHRQKIYTERFCENF